MLIKGRTIEWTGSKQREKQIDKEAAKLALTWEEAVFFVWYVFDWFGIKVPKKFMKGH